MNKILNRCEIVPLPGQQVSLRIDGIEQTRWLFGHDLPRPCFYPVLGPGSGTLTRMGHPGAENHDHHQSVWFAHNKLLGIDFWSNNSDARIRQQRWLVYDDGDEFARMAVSLGWFDGHDPRPLVEQELIVTLTPLDGGEYLLDLQSTFVPQSAELEFQQTNFGFLAVRMAKSISAHFGDGELTGASRDRGEPALFGKSNSWMDYSGPVVVLGDDRKRTVVTEGITYCDHPENPGHPARWHVRDDGWMGASACRDGGLITTREKPLCVRYLLYVHAGGPNPEKIADLMATWVAQPRLNVQKSAQPHRQFEIVPVSM